MGKTIELWKRNPVECIKELIGNPAFKDDIKYAPEQHFTSPDCNNHIFNEMWTGEWWWDIQKELPHNATITPVILASDKTQLSTFSGDKQAWPVYLSIGNIRKSVRCAPSARATVLVGYLPVTKLECFSDSRRALEGYRLFHTCMHSLLEPLIAAGKQGVRMVCTNGQVRRIYLIVAAYITDHPEQCLMACCKENHCPKCTVKPDQCGELLNSLLRDPQETCETIARESHGQKPEKFEAQGMRLIDPFWQELPHCNIFACIAPDLLHQLHKGVFKDHTVKWATECFAGGAAEIDRHFKAMTHHPNLRHFKKSISTISQWTGTEYKNMEKVFLGVLTGGACSPAVLRAVRAVLDFIYYAHFETHTTDSIIQLEATLDAFHENKHVFADEGVRDDFNIPKVHSEVHYGTSIRSLGTADGFNMEGSERLHIDYAKQGYRASNKKAYVKQMTVWLTCQETIHQFRSYLAWAEPMSTSVDVPDDEDDEDLDDDNEEEIEETSNTYSVAKEPGLGQVSIKTLTETFGCTNFLCNLEDFLCKSTHNKKLPKVAEHMYEQTRFAVYKRMKVDLPAARQVSCINGRQDTVRAMPAIPATIHRKVVPSHFDTVLAYEFLPDVVGSDKVDPLEGQSIFCIPETYGRFASKHPLAYVEWFTPLQTICPDTGMFKISPSTRRHRHRTAIIPITQIARSCHLIPHWGHVMDRTWASADILDKCSSFYVNPYLHHDDFLLLQYLQSQSKS
ncbi:hypothetical protein POSPLADRAFT_1133402 [Postia placenta MAD-698-R-SB12]|uniref:CxC2-like cysteine cluster KDZ transposase-associated domain-containing protein n=1 Tax=Postia placenta MAD-698-R-SB12 TaxID=670580 RepID=A0A1X6NDC5_9APHY|nr:hypothetical protein POSPLADRAFT_1133402 [Postia placenta MAD-698-R-SB12]OSX66647.1 hypothetical protein POSPLADRAFT_1133402 [Postia placenta MAD-698-R-SB12]